VIESVNVERGNYCYLMNWNAAGSKLFAQEDDTAPRKYCMTRLYTYTIPAHSLHVSKLMQFM